MTDNKKKLKLSDILPYIGDGTIQVSLEEDGDWNKYIEVQAKSVFLRNLLEWRIVDMGAEESDEKGNGLIIRVSISESNADMERKKAVEEAIVRWLTT